MTERVIAIRVQDIARQLWFNWDSGNWDSYPSCMPGNNNLYVAFWIIIEPVYPIHTEYVTLELIATDTGTVLASKSLWVSSELGQGAGLEWTGNMPTSPYRITCSVAPPPTPTIKITPNQAKHGDLIKIEAFNFPPNIVLYGISPDTPPEGEVIGTTDNNGYLAIDLPLGFAAPIGVVLIRVVGYILQDSNIIVYEAHAYLEVLE